MGVTNSRDSSEWKTVSSNLSKNQVSVWSSPDRSVCIMFMPSARKLSFLETRSTQQGGGCNATKLVSSIRTHPIRFPPIILDSKSLTQNSTGPSSDNDTYGASLANITLVPQASTIINSQSNHHTSHTKSTAKCIKGGSSISGKQNIKVTGLESFRESVIDSGLSKSANSLISSARRPSSNSNYDSS